MKHAFENVKNFDEIVNDLQENNYQSCDEFVTSYEDISILPANTLDMLVKSFNDSYKCGKNLDYCDYIDEVANDVAKEVFSKTPSDETKKLYNYLLENKVVKLLGKYSFHTDDTLGRLVTLVLSEMLVELMHTTSLFNYLNIELAKFAIGKACNFNHPNVQRALNQVMETYHFETNPYDYICHLITTINEGSTHTVNFSIDLSVTIQDNEIDDDEKLKRGTSHMIEKLLANAKGVKTVTIKLH